MKNNFNWLKAIQYSISTLVEMFWYVARVVRMANMLLQFQITWRSFKQSLRPQQRAICLIGGGFVFCDGRDERDYFQ